jgi:hypothetical protein
MEESKFENGLKFAGGPRYAGLGLAKRAMEARVLRGGRKPQRYSWTGTGETGREKLAGMHRPGDTG